MATVANRFTGVLGPFKMEVLNLTSVTDQDTFTTNMQNPKFAMAVSNLDGGDGNSIAISGKTLTITNTGLSGATVNVLVFGF